MKRDEFYNLFPHLFELPAHPQCVHCLLQSDYTINGSAELHLVEFHRDACPLASRNKMVTPLGVVMGDAFVPK